MMNSGTKPLVSVILPAFNAGNYISASVESILNQSFSDFELIAINDGSTDDTLETLLRYEKIDRRVIVISRPNKGLVDTLNEGIDAARGQWIARMDADDIALPNRFALQLTVLEQTGADICGGWVECFGTSNGHIIRHPIDDAEIKAALFFGSAFAHPTVMMRSSLVKQLKYDRQWEKCEDYDLWQRAVYTDWKMANVPEVILRYRQHDTQISTASGRVQQDLTQKLRRRHWQRASTEMSVKTEWIDALLKLREPSPYGVNLNFVNSALLALMEHTSTEARLVVLDHTFRLYARAAASSPNIVGFWTQLNRDFGIKVRFIPLLKLFLLRLFRVDPESIIFNQFKKVFMCNGCFFTAPR